MKTSQTLITLMMVGTTPLIAQDGFRHLDLGRPVHLEDAYALKLHEWEWQLGTNVSRAAGDTHINGVFEFKVGLFPNGQVGTEAELGWNRRNGVSETAIESWSLHALYNLNHETLAVPAFGIRVDAVLPGAGATARSGFGLRSGFRMTRTVGSTRLHLNAGFDVAEAADGGNEWVGSIGIDRALGLSSTLVIINSAFSLPTAERSLAHRLELGLRRQMSRTMVIDMGVSSHTDRWWNGTPNISLTVGLSRSFGIAALLPEPAGQPIQLR